MISAEVERAARFMPCCAKELVMRVSFMVLSLCLLSLASGCPLERSCEVDGKKYRSGTSFPDSDGCNACSCNDGTVSCTAAYCGPAPDCDVDGESVADGTQWPAPDGCNVCSCALGEVACTEEACPPAEPETACVVGGTEYASGTEGIDDPFSCNECECQQGSLACTRIGCPESCPEGSAPGESCARCGPTDGCEAVEHACLPACKSDTDCQDTGYGFCSDGVCRNLCG
jgi:hypothetical protein